MKKIRWWGLGGVVVALLTATAVGPMVHGQPDPPPMLPGSQFPASQPGPIVPAPVQPTVPAPLPPAIPGSLPPAIPAPLPPTVPTPIAGSSPGSVIPISGIAIPSQIPPPIAGLTVPPVGSKPPAAIPDAPAPNTPLTVKLQQMSLSVPANDGAPAAELRPGRQEPAVSIEWFGPATTRVNQPMACQLIVRNTSPTAVHNVVVRHRLGQGVTCKASEPHAVVDQGELSWSIGTLAAGQIRHIDVELLVAVKGPLTCQATLSFSGTVAHQVLVNEPQLHVQLKVPERVLADEPVALLFTLTNPGDGPAEKVKLKALLPEGLEHKHGRAIEVDVGTLAANESRTMQLVCTARGSGSQQCQAIASADGGLRANDEANLEIILPKLDLVLAGPKLRYIDRKAIYVLKVTNPGSAPAPNVVLRGTVPASFKYVGAAANGMYDEGTRTASWVLGDLQPGQTREVTLDLVPTAPGDHKLAAQVTSARGLKIDAETRTLVEGLPTLLIDVNDTDDPVEVGSETTYEVRVANTGTKTETNVEVVCTLPDQVEFRSAKAGANLRSCVEGREVIFEPVAKLAPRADVIYRITVRGKLPGDARFRVRVRSDGQMEPILREESTRFYNDNATAK